MIFLVVIYLYESWTIKKAECQRTSNCGVRETLESSLGCKEIKPINPKGNQPWIIIGRTDAKLQYFGPLLWRANSLEKTLMLGKTEGRRRKGQQRMRWLDGIMDSRDVSLSKPRRWRRTGKPGVLSARGCKQSDTTEWTATTFWIYFSLPFKI